MKEGAKMIFHDPLVEFWQEMGLKICNNISDLKDHKHDIVVFTVRHKDYLELPVTSMLSYFPKSVLFVDAFNVLSKDKIKKLKESGKEIIGIGKGDLNTLQKRF
jgi:UDP-N-acetyl-D-mannosaminuronate dehydrogenase